MFETIGTGLLGSLFGGLFRLAPELLKHFDKKNEREHELKMFSLQTEVEKVRGEYRLEEKYVDHSISQLDAISEAFKQQSEDASKSYPWVSALSALVRPLVTYFLFLFYMIFKVTMIVAAWKLGVPWHEIVTVNWTLEDFAMLNMILTFWFVGRSIERYNKPK